MTPLTLQCPTCGLNLRHGRDLMARVAGRRGATRCPRCHDRVCFDATGEVLRVSFPDLYGERDGRTSTTIYAETAPPPLAVESRFPSEERGSHVATRSHANANVPGPALRHPPLPLDLMEPEDRDPEPVFPLMHLKRLRRYG